MQAKQSPIPLFCFRSALLSDFVDRGDPPVASTSRYDSKAKHRFSSYLPRSFFATPGNGLLNNIKSTIYGSRHSRGSFGPVSFIVPFLVIPAGGSCDAGPAQISFTIKMD